MNRLTPNQRSTFEFQVKKTRDINERNRLCVLLARDDGLKPDPKGGSAGKLSKLQTKELVEYLSQYTYRRVKDVCAYVLERYKISYSTGGMISWLKYHQFCFQKPC